MSSRTGFVWHELYAWHDIGTVTAHLPAGGFLQPDVQGEGPEAKRRLRNLLEVSGLLGQLQLIPPRSATFEELSMVHDPAYVAEIRDLAAAGGGDAGEMTPFGRDSFDIAALAAGGCIQAVDAILGGEVENAYALVRPPGHHAERSRGRGFCLFANVAIAAAHARRAFGLQRVAVVDWDVHHGNGTQSIFWDDPGVLTISVHQDRSFPLDSGSAEEIGAGPGEGFNFNVPLPAGCGGAVYERIFEESITPILRRFQPELIVVACGFDAGPLDPYGQMLVHSESFRAIARTTLEIAAEVCDGRLLACHEGGYSTAYVPFCGHAVIEQMSGVRTAVKDPFLDELANTGGQSVLPHQVEACERSSARARRFMGGA